MVAPLACVWDGTPDDWDRADMTCWQQVCEGKRSEAGFNGFQYLRGLRKRLQGRSRPPVMHTKRSLKKEPVFIPIISSGGRQ
jgi:hypothetical protein